MDQVIKMKINVKSMYKEYEMCCSVCLGKNNYVSRTKVVIGQTLLKIPIFIFQLIFQLDF